MRFALKIILWREVGDELGYKTVKLIIVKAG